LDKSPVFIYVLKCLAGLSAGYILYISFPQYPFFWSIISTLLVLAPDAADSNKLAFDRMRANIIGSTAGLLIFLIHEPTFLLICAGIVLTIMICSMLKLMGTVRTSLAALIIVTVHAGQPATWHTAVERMVCVVAGCVIGLAVTFIFSFSLKDGKISNTH